VCQPETQRRIDIHTENSTAANPRFQNNAANSGKRVKQAVSFSEARQVHKQAGVTHGQPAAAERLPVATIALYRAHIAGRFQQENTPIWRLFSRNFSIFRVEVAETITLAAPLQIMLRMTGDRLERIYRLSIAEAGQA
jgi:hypothetical protein